ncbi:MAG TPA: hypothetical protein PLS69_06855, partial [Terricaulis sp.]|nr:hypothetical protein [Terricaulis sp.]
SRHPAPADFELNCRPRARLAGDSLARLGGGFAYSNAEQGALTITRAFAPDAARPWTRRAAPDES